MTLATLGRARLLAGSPPAWWIDALETGVLWMTFFSVPPVLAIGLYFAVWHSLRHVARVWLLDEPSTAGIAADRWFPGLSRFVLAAAVPTLLAVGLLGGLWALFPAAPTTTAGLAGLGLVGVAILTLPHVVVVSWLDSIDAAGTGP